MTNWRQSSFPIPAGSAAWPSCRLLILRRWLPNYTAPSRSSDSSVLLLRWDLLPNEWTTPTMNISTSPLWSWMRRFGSIRRPPTIPDYADEKLSQFYDWLLVGWLHDTTSAMFRIVLSGVFDRYPTIRIV